MRIGFWAQPAARGVLALTAVLALCWPGLTAIAAAAGGPAGTHDILHRRSAQAARQLTRSWAASQRADRRLVARARAKRACRARSRRCREAQAGLQQAGRQLIRDQRGLARAVSGTEARAVAAGTRRNARRMRAPRLRVAGHSLRWSQVAGVKSYLLARHVPGQAVQYTLTSQHTTTPPPMPGTTVGYRVRTALDGSSWSQEVTLSYPSSAAPSGPPAASPVSPGALPDTQAAPVLSAEGTRLSWTPVAGVGAYVLRTVLGGTEQFTAEATNSATPPAQPGQTVSYSVRTAVVGSAWSATVTIAYPAAPSETPASPPPSEGPTPPILGIVGGSGWGPQVAAQVIHSGFSSERLEAGSPYENDATSFKDGFRNDQVIVGNTPDGEPLASVEINSWVRSTLAQVKEAVSYGYTLLEVGNEVYSKGGRAEPVKYAQMYMALSRELEHAGITGVTLIFDSFGDYALPGGEESTMAAGRGWLGDALKAEPELKQRVSAFSSHPYGLPGIKYSHGDWAIEGLEAQHADALALGFAHTGFYATEYGETDTTNSSLQIQAERIKWAYTKMLALPWVRGIWYYQLHDDSTGGWGLVSGNYEARPALAVLEGLIRAGL